MFSACLPFFRIKNSKNEKISGPCKPNLSNMPILVIEEVLKNLDVQSIFCLRKVCRLLRFTVDRIKPHVKSLQFQLPLTKKSLKSYTKHMNRSYKKLYMKYHKRRTGCTIGWKIGKIYECRQIPMGDAVALLNNPKLILEELHINLRFSIENASEYIEKKEEDLKKFYKSMKSLLENKNLLSKTKEIHLEVYNLSEAVGLLKCIDQKSLIPMEQQGKLKSNNGMFTSSRTIEVQVDKIQMKKLNELEELFICSPMMNTIIIKSHEFYGMKDKLLSNFGQFHSYDEEFEIFLSRSTWAWLKNISDSTEKLQISLNIGLENIITFSKV